MKQFLINPHFLKKEMGVRFELIEKDRDRKEREKLFFPAYSFTKGNKRALSLFPPCAL
jgi:hypothetical protein